MKKTTKVLLITIPVILIIAIIISVILFVIPALNHDSLSINERTFKEYTEVETELLDIEYSYLNEEGYVDTADIESLLNEVEDKLKDKSFNETLKAYYREGNCILIEFNSGINYIFAPYQKEALSNGTESKIATFSPINKGYLENIKRIEANLDIYFELPYKGSSSVSGNAEYIVKAFPDKYSYQTSYNPYVNTDIYGNAYDYKDSLVTVESLKKLGDYGLVIFEGHGNYTEKTGPVIFTGESFIGWKDISKYKEDIKEKRIFLSSFPTIPNTDIPYSPARQYAVSSKFFEKYIGTMNDTILFFGACCSGKDQTLADAFFSKGAKGFVGYTDYTSLQYETVSRSMFFYYMTQCDMDIEKSFNATISTKSLGKDFEDGFSSELVYYLNEKQDLSIATTETPTQKPTEKPTETPVQNENFIGTVEKHQEGIAISSAEDLQNIENNTTKTYYLTNDIDFSKYNNGVWLQIPKFSGKLYGNGYSIKNFSTYAYDSAGMFAHFDNAEIHDVGFENIYIEADNFEDASCGVISSYSIDSIIDNCFIINSEIKSCDDAGSFVSYASGTRFIKLYTNAKLSVIPIPSDNDYMSSQVGGIIGGYDCHDTDEEQVFNNCVVDSVIVSTVDQYQYVKSGGIYIGGIVGRMNATSGPPQNSMGEQIDNTEPKNIIFSHCKFNGTISGNGGQAWNSNKLDTGATLYDTCDVYAGGIIGYAETDWGSGTGIWSGKISITDSSVSADIKASSMQTSYAGGVAGFINIFNFKNMSVIIDNVTFDGSIETTGDIGRCNSSRIGGIVGYGGSSNISFSNIKAKGTLTDSSDCGTNVGGLCGSCDGTVEMNNVDVSQISLNVTSNAKGEWKRIDDVMPSN